MPYSNKAWLLVCRSLVKVWEEVDPGGGGPVVLHVATINDAIHAIHSRVSPDAVQAQVLVTGSLLLLGNMLQLIEPHLSFKPDPHEEARLVRLYDQLAAGQTAK